jgi:hypothetical protein
MTITGDIIADLYASTSGTDSDWVVKLIDLYPSDDPTMANYELMVADEIFRGRYLKSFEKAEPLTANAVNKYAIDMRWRPVAESWFLTLRLTSGRVIVSGAPVRDRTDCLLGVTPPSGTTRPRGAIMSYDPKGRGDPTLESFFADDVRLYYVPAGLDPADFAVYQSEVV